MKRVLIITYYWPPAGGGGVQRWVKFTRYLRLFHWEPVIFTVKGGDYPILDASLGTEVPEDVEVVRQPIVEPYTLYHWFKGKSSQKTMDANFLSQGKKLGWQDKLAVWVRGNFFIPDARFLWIRPSAKALIKYLKTHPVDAIISTGPPHSCHLIAKKITETYRIPWIVDYRDPWTQIDYFDDLSLTKLARIKHERLEKSVLDNCSVVVTVGQTMADDLRPLTNTRLEVITNGFDESDRPENPVPLDSKFTVTYIGTMNDARNPLVLWEALSSFRTEDNPICKDIEVRLVGKPESVVQQSVSEFSLQDAVNFIGYVSHKEAIAYQNSAHVLLLVINNTSNNKSILTGKIFEYLASGRPVLCIGPSDGDAAAIIRQAGAGVLCDYTDVIGVKKFLQEQYNYYLKGGSQGLKSDISVFSRKSLTAKLASLLDELCEIPG